MNLDVLPMPKVREQRHHHGATMTSQTELDRTGIDKAKRSLFDRVMARVEQQLDAEHVLRAVEPFKEESLLDEILSRLEAVEELSPPRLDLESLSRRLQALREVAGSTGGNAGREVDDVSKACLADAARQLRRETAQAWETTPSQAGTLLLRARRELEGLLIQASRPRPMNQLKKLIGDLVNLANVQPGLPRRCKGRIVGQLLMRGQSLFPEAMRELVRHQLPRFFEDARSEMRDVLREWADRSAAYRALIDAVNAELDDQTTQTELRATTNRCSATVLLPGADEAEVIAGIKERLAVSDVAGVAERLHAKFLEAVRGHVAQTLAGQSGETDASLPALLMMLSPGKIAELWARVVEAHLGRGQGLYERLTQAGIKVVARQLYDRAEHTVSVGGRANTRLNVNITRVALVALPAPRTQDAPIRKALIDELKDVDPSIKVFDLPEGHPEVIFVLRIEHGFPVGILMDNYALLPAYGEAAPAGHPMHVMTLTSQTDANARPDYLEIDRLLRHEPLPGGE